MQDEPLPQKELGRRSEPREPVDQYHSVELTVSPNRIIYQFRIWNISQKGMCILLKEDFAAHMVVGFARFDGMVAGIATPNPDELSGIMEPDASDKYDRFIMFLDAFNIPLITFSDTTAFPPGDKWERMGVIRHGAKNLHGYSHLTNPKVTIVLRRSYGGSNIVLGCSKMGPDFIYAWPTTEFAPTGP